MKSRFLMCLTAITLFATAALASNTWYVNGVNGSDNNDCKSPQTACKTIGHAISLASSGDSILVAAATYTENLTINFSLKLIGSGAATTIVDGGGVGTVVSIPSGGTHVTLSRVTIRNGRSSVGGGIYSFGTLEVSGSTITGNVAASLGGSGGGIFNRGTLTINNSTVSGNHASGVSGSGGGIANDGTLTINKSTISGNSAAGRNFGSGGGIVSKGTLTITNGTISGNTASIPACQYNCSVRGGGIYIYGSGTINNSTLSGNYATAATYGGAEGGGILSKGTLTINNTTISGNGASSQNSGSIGGGIYGTATLQDSIVANNSAQSGGNCSGTITSKGYNASSDNSCDFDNTGDLNHTDPKLGQLGNYGGPTQTIPLLSGSPAIDAGNPSGCTDSQGHLLKTDQRGKPRPDKEDTGGCDMGAYERQKD